MHFCVQVWGMLQGTLQELLVPAEVQTGLLHLPFYPALVSVTLQFIQSP